MARDTARQVFGCCAAGMAAMETAQTLADDRAQRWVSQDDEGMASVDLMVPGINCAGCMRAIEDGLAKLAGVAESRVNLSLRRVRVRFAPDAVTVDRIRERLDDLGYEAKPFDGTALAEIDKDTVGRDLLSRLAVAGFAAMNVMLLSISVWSGAEAATRDLLHWISALIALPAIAYAGVPFFRSAAQALKARRLNMDVPISLAVCLAAGTSLYETSMSGQHAYFDAGISLLFFLLVGRYLDHRTRAKARSAAAELTALAALSANVIGEDGERYTVPADELTQGMLIEVLPGERVPADGIVETGTSDLDRSLVTGESMPEPVEPGALVHAGMANLSGPLRLRAQATGEETLLAEIARMIEAAERGKTRYDRWADQAARIYAPGVHLIAAVAFLGWLWSTGDWRMAITIASAVLIITCPCALALAVPAVHAVAGGKLFRRGIFLKDGAALERLAGIDTVVFDKTGTLTDGSPAIAEAPETGHPAWPIAAALAEASRHPMAKALAAEAAARGIEPANLTDLREVPGSGMEGRFEGETFRLGRADWVGAEPTARSSIWLGVADGRNVKGNFGTPLAFFVSEVLRKDAPSVCAGLRSTGLKLALFSGDASEPVVQVSRTTGVDSFKARMTPADKLNALEILKENGARVLMVGDGLNDAPALAAANVSMSPVSAADVSRAAADLVFTGEKLEPVHFAIKIAKLAKRRALQNFALAALYNAIAIPLALAGFVTPLVAALAMSGSSIVVTLNALRMRVT